MKNLLTLPTKYQLQTMNIAFADGVMLPVSVIGSGKPVLMLHAYGMDAREFLPFILSLTGEYTFYLPHFRGFGKQNLLTSLSLILCANMLMI